MCSGIAFYFPIIFAWAKMHIGIVGAGLSGLLLAYRLHLQGMQITIFEKNAASTANNCASVAAGMLSPSAESITGEKLIYQLGSASLSLWHNWLSDLGKPNYIQQNGSIVLAHRQDRAELQLLRQQLCYMGVDAFADLTADDLRALEPDLSHFSSGIYLPTEAHIHNRELLASLQEYMLMHDDIKCCFNVSIYHLQPFQVKINTTTYKFDWVIDCRGLGAQVDRHDLRGVRGEIAWIKSYDVNISRPIRLMHPRQ